jgi:TetR/AcrR family transcriptional regulator, mexJK operon transcriptional repressor
MATDAFHYGCHERKGKAILENDPSPAETRPKAGRPTRERAEARHNELLDTALDMFLECGFEMTTMEGVAAAVGMTKRTIYARYDGKAALFKATVRRAIKRNIVARAIFDALDTGDLENTLTAFATMRIAHFQTDAGLKLQRIVNTESFRFPEIFTWYYEQSAGPAIDFLADLFSRQEKGGTLSVGDPRMAANAFMSMVVGGPVRIIVSGNPLGQEEIDARIAFAVRLFLDGARTRAKTPQMEQNI